MIRGVIREFTTSATSAGGKKVSTSADTTTKSKAYDKAKTTKTTTARALATSNAAEPKTRSGVAKVYQRPSRRGGTEYSSRSGPSWTANPAYTTWQNANTKAKMADDAAKSDEESKRRIFTTAQDRDTTAAQGQAPPSGGSGVYGTGTSAGKGRGKGRKGKGKKED